MNRLLRTALTRGALLLAVCLLLAPLGSPVAADDEPAGGTAAPAGEAKPEPKKEIVRRPMLWMVEGKTRIYLYGTIHLADKRVLTHLPVVKQALEHATALYTELRMDQQGQMEIQGAVMRRAPLPAGETLTKLLTPELHARVAKVLPAQMPLVMMDGFKPWLVLFGVIQTLMQEHQKKHEEKAKEESGESAGGDTPQQALDAVLFAEAKAAGKRVGGIETIDTQIDVFDSMSLEEQVGMLGDLVTEVEKIRGEHKDDEGDDKGEDDEEDSLELMLDLWLAGDADGFFKLFAESLREQSGKDAEVQKKFMKGLLDDRNVGMAKKIIELSTKDPEQCWFFAVGAGHMPGENGVVKLLRDKGYSVKRVELGDKLPALPKKEAKPAAKKLEPVGAGG